MVPQRCPSIGIGKTNYTWGGGEALRFFRFCFFLLWGDQLILQCQQFRAQDDQQGIHVTETAPLAGSGVSRIQGRTTLWVAVLYSTWLRMMSV